MRKEYIAPLLEIYENEELCETGLNSNSYKENTTTPGNDTNIPVTPGPGLGGDEGEDTNPAAKKGGFFNFDWDD